MRKTILGLTFLLLASTGFCAELVVPSQYSTIQSAIDAASDGDTIIVQPGTYYENIQWDVNELTLTSVNPEDPCIINATVLPGGGIQFDPEVNGGLLTGFTIGAEYSYGNYGVSGNHVTTATISHCIIRNMSRGVVGWCGEISNCLFIGNGSAVVTQSINSLSLVNCTITNNDIAVEKSSSDFLNVINCIIWGNNRLYFNQSYDAKIVIMHSCVQGGAFGENNIEEDPLFIDAVNGDFRLQADSPCIDAGKHTGPVFMPQRDLGGNFRRIDGNGDDIAVIDMGAYEYGLATGPIVSVWPEEILFLSLYGAIPEPQKFYVSNIGPGWLNWVITEDCPWLSVDPMSGYSTQVTVTVDTGGLSYFDRNIYNLVVRDSAGNSQAVVRVDYFMLEGRFLNVPAQYPTIQSAIDAANEGDTVVVAPGRYMGPGNTGLDLMGKSITVRSVDPNDQWVVNNTVIDCNRQGGGFIFQTPTLSGPNSVVEGFTITNGAGTSGYGGGIKITYGSPVIRNCIITNNFAQNGGGGIYCSGSHSSPSIINCDITNNYANTYGGGIYISSGSSPSIIDCRITGNLSGSRGGGICCMPGNPVIKSCLISNNMTTNSDGYGGGIWMSNDTTSVIEDCKILNNKSVMGAGLCVGPQSSSTGSTIITSSEITGNMASSQGGGIWTTGNTPFEISDSIINANFAQDDGGFHIQSNNYFKANRCTISGNSGGGIDFLGGRAVLTNCILWGNLRPGDTITNAQITPPWNPESPFIEIRNNCIQDDDANDANIPFGGADYGNIDDDPIFVNPDANDYHLRKDSPCIDAGEPFYASWTKVKDIDGEPRVMGFAFDMGADEYGKMIIVTRPVEGEVWATESWHQIKWDKFGVGSVDIILSTDGGITWESIAEGIPDANSYLWQLPGDMDSNQCIISVVPSVTDANVLVFESELFTISWYPTRPAVPPQWLRRGLLPAQESISNQGPEIGCVKWVFETNGPVSSQVAVTRPYWDSYWIYIGSEDGNIYALDDFGELMWSYDINTPIVGSPAVGYYWMVYVAGQNGWLFAFDEFGDISWTYKTNAPIYSSPVVGYDGKIYVCTEDGLIYALDANGSELWTFATKGPANLSGAIFATPVIDKNGTVYIGGLYEPNLYALDANYGTVKWICNFSAGIDPCESSTGQIFASPAIGPDGTIYQTLIGDPNLYAVDPCTGNIFWKTQLRPDPCYSCDLYPWPCCRTFDRYLTAVRNHTTITYSDNLSYLNTCDEGKWQGISVQGWMYSLNSSGWSSPVVGSDGTIYVSFDDPYLRAVEPNGTIKWITRLGTVGGFTLSIDKNNLIYAASDDNFVCIVEPNGKELSRFEGNNWVSFPAIAEDGTLIVSDANNRVWAISNQDCYFQPAALHRPQDVDSGWTVNFMDFAVLANSWLDCTDQYNSPLCQAGIDKYGLYSPADVDRDQYVDTWDLAEMVDKWLLETSDSQSWSQKDWQDWPHTHGPTVIGGPQF